MLFNSWDFWLAFLPAYALYLALGRRAQNLLLLAFSAVFYGYWDWRFLGLLWWSTFEDYYCALRIHNSSDPAVRRRYLLLSAAGNLGILGAFKYYGFFADSAARALAGLGWSVSPPLLQVAVPLGLSFYTFQTLGYTLDVYRGKSAPTRSFLDFALFVSFFPQLVAGPIERASRLLPQIESQRRVTLEKILSGAWLVLWGLFQKAVVADNLARWVDPVYASPAPAPSAAALAFYAFPLQVYCDFSGYSDMARGLGRLMGFELSVNFRLPFFAESPRDFWRRWHITLGDWFRENLYIPLGGGRSAVARNLMVVFFLSGLWHGAGWNFILFGAFWGAVAVADRFLAAAGTGGSRRAPRPLRAAAMFHLVALGFCLFRTPSLSRLGEIGTAWLRAPALPETNEAARLLVAAAPLFFVDALRWPDRDAESVLERSAFTQAFVFVWCALWLVWLGRESGQEYIYFRF